MPIPHDELRAGVELIYTVDGREIAVGRDARVDVGERHVQIATSGRVTLVAIEAIASIERATPVS